MKVNFVIIFIIFFTPCNCNKRSKNVCPHCPVQAAGEPAPGTIPCDSHCLGDCVRWDGSPCYEYFDDCYCRGMCGDGTLDWDEECDGGEGCINCHCASGWRPDEYGNCIPIEPEECTSWYDEDYDGLISAEDPDCYDEVVGTIWIFVPGFGDPVCHDGGSTCDGVANLTILTTEFQWEMCLDYQPHGWWLDFYGKEKEVNIWIEAYDLEVWSERSFEFCKNGLDFPDWPSSGCYHTTEVPFDGVRYDGFIQRFNIYQRGPGL
ncbi:hypothetical protein GF366_02935 [Candidatus Peregrinibacteria bacterium]|nr:hypothetical protein [Candidatus Peregrinibacteria bacterium]